MLAARGALDRHVPDDYSSLLILFKLVGMDIEVDKEILRLLYDSALASQSYKNCDELRKDIRKLLFPDMKDEFTTLSEQVKTMVEKDGDVMRVGTNQGAEINSRIVSKTYRQIGG